MKFNFSSLIIEGDGRTRFNLLIKDSKLRYSLFASDLSAAYIFINNKKHKLNLGAGAKLIYNKVDLSVKSIGNKSYTTSKDHLFVDPVFVIRYLYRPITRIELATYADIGTALFDNTFSYQYSFSARYLFTKVFSLGLNYRSINLQSNLDRGVFTGTISGPVLSFEFQF